MTRFDCELHNFHGSSEDGKCPMCKLRETIDGLDICPKCKGKNLDFVRGDDPTIELYLMKEQREAIHCKDCGAMWEGTFLFVGVRNVRG